jgi:hypothetical protein
MDLTRDRLNTRRTIRGRGTDRQGATTNNTNMFHLGTRMPSMGPADLGNWDSGKVCIFIHWVGVHELI